MSCVGCGSPVSTFMRGAVGLAKMGMQAAGVPIDQAPPALVQARRDVCRECPEATRNLDPRYVSYRGLTNLSRCAACNCFIVAKTRLASERCPLSKW